MEIRSWAHMTEVLPTMSEEELKETINYEVLAYRRKAILERLHMRYARLVSKRQREEIMEGKMLL